MKSPLPMVDEACYILQQEESQREILKPVKEEAEGAAMLSKANQSPVTCTACGKTGHAREKCWTVVGYPPWFDKGGNSDTRGGRGSYYQRGGRNPRGNRGGRNPRGGRTYAGVVQTHKEQEAGSSSSVNTGVNITQQQLEQILKLLPTPSTKIGKGDSDDEMFEVNYAQVIKCHYAAEEECRSWIIDSGATNHMITDQIQLQNMKTMKEGPKISLPTGETASITHKGKVKLKNSIQLEDVLLVPKFKHNLLSVQRLVRDGDYKVEFYPSYCVISDRNNGDVVGIGKASQGLYYLVDKSLEEIADEARRNVSQSRLRKQEPRCNYVRIPSEIKYPAKISEELLWHQRLGHAPMSKIRKIPELSVLHQHTAEVCITCPRAKMTKVEYNRSMSRAKEIFDLIHLDIWGPYKVMTRTHCRYFMTIVDDYSRVIWVQLLKQKSDAYEAIKGFLKMVKTQYGKQVKVIRSDNAFEFEDNQCKALYADQGVVHQTSCVDRPQQNGRAERKHRNILEMSRALRFQAGLGK